MRSTGAEAGAARISAPRGIPAAEAAAAEQEQAAGEEASWTLAVGGHEASPGRSSQDTGAGAPRFGRVAANAVQDGPCRRRPTTR